MIRGKCMKIISAVFVTALLMYSSAFAGTGTYEKAFTSYTRGNFRAAAGYLVEYVEKRPDPEAYYLLGYANYKMKKYPESIGYFRDAYILDPSITLEFLNRKR
jgi:TolA-binding protein